MGAGIWTSKKELLCLSPEETIFHPRDTWDHYRNEIVEWERAVRRSKGWVQDWGFTDVLMLPFLGAITPHTPIYCPLFVFGQYIGLLPCSYPCELWNVSVLPVNPIWYSGRQWFIDVELVGKSASLGSRPVLFMKILVPHTSGRAGSPWTSI